MLFWEVVLSLKAFFANQVVFSTTYKWNNTGAIKLFMRYKPSNVI